MNVYEHVCVGLTCVCVCVVSHVDTFNEKVYLCG